MSLEDLRKGIDAVDEKIVQLLNDRQEIAKAIGALKKDSERTFYDPKREEAIFSRIQKLNRGLLCENALKAIYREIISAGIAIQKTLSIAYLGPEGTFTHLAAKQQFGSSVCYEPFTFIEDVFDAVCRKHVDYGVVPIENSTEGPVTQSYDCFVKFDLKILGEVILPIDHCLIAQSDMRNIEKICSKKEALEECRGELSRHAGVILECVSSTVEGVKMAKRDSKIAAIGSALSAKLYDVPILKRGIQDKKDNKTRFLVLGRDYVSSSDTEKDKTSLLISIKNDVGALERIIQTFSQRGIHLCKIESRPSHLKLWDYVFFIEFKGSWLDGSVQSAIQECQKECLSLKWLGTYPSGIEF